MEFYWCLEHHTVEEREGCRADNRLGPFPTREGAERALQTVKERNEKADAEDRRWDEGED